MMPHLHSLDEFRLYARSAGGLSKASLQRLQTTSGAAVKKLIVYACHHTTYYIWVHLTLYHHLPFNKLGQSLAQLLLIFGFQRNSSNYNNMSDAPMSIHKTLIFFGYLCGQPQPISGGEQVSQVQR
jgi:hypothetical protein